MPAILIEIGYITHPNEGKESPIKLFKIYWLRVLLMELRVIFITTDEKAKLIFKDNTPFSLDFDDFYFNSKDGLNESKFVYTHSFEWKNQENFIIAESGFGIGLNFFLL